MVMPALLGSVERRYFLSREALVASPTLHWESTDVTVDVYRAKPAGEEWASADLREFVLQARGSYHSAYGFHVTTFDEYDSKSWVYLAVATYETCQTLYREALTLRFVPAAGLPLLNDDLNSYILRDSPQSGLLKVLSQRLEIDEMQALQNCFSQGRMGAMRPCAADGTILSGNRHVGLSWALMLECFLGDIASEGGECEILTSQTTDQLRILGSRVPSRPCDTSIGFGAGTIVLNRQAPSVRALCYGTPTYFLNLKDVSALLSRLIEQGTLTREAAQAAVTNGVMLERALRYPRAATWKGLRRLFSSSGRLWGSMLTGEALRCLADVEVRDGPVLRLTQMKELEGQLERLRAGADLPRQTSFIRELGDSRNVRSVEVQVDDARRALALAQDRRSGVRSQDPAPTQNRQDN